MPRYRAFSLDIETDFPVREFGFELDRDGDSDVTVREQKIPADPASRGYITATPEKLHFTVDAGHLAVRNGSEIHVDRNGNNDPAAIRPYLLGAGFGGLLHQRNVLLLHGSVVSIGDRAVAFLGESGRGKSTLAAAFYDAGHEVVSDDITAVSPTAKHHRVLPGFPTLKLDPGHLLAPQDVESWPNPAGEKRFYRVPRDDHPRPLPLERVYVLDDGSSPTIEQFDAQTAVRALIRHTYRAYLVEPMGRAERHLQQCTELAERTPVLGLQRPKTVDALSEVRRLVEEDLARDD